MNQLDVFRIKAKIEDHLAYTVPKMGLNNGNNLPKLWLLFGEADGGAYFVRPSQSTHSILS